MDDSGDSEMEIWRIILIFPRFPTKEYAMILNYLDTGNNAENKII